MNQFQKVAAVLITIFVIITVIVIVRYNHSPESQQSESK